jgi:hypothetical protein
MEQALRVQVQLVQFLAGKAGRGEYHPWSHQFSKPEMSFEWKWEIILL